MAVAALSTRDSHPKPSHSPSLPSCLPLSQIMTWQAVIFGPDDTPWEGGTFKLLLEFTEDYPNKVGRGWSWLRHKGKECIRALVSCTLKQRRD